MLDRRSGDQARGIFIGAILALVAFLLWLIRNRPQLAARPRAERIGVIVKAWLLVLITSIAVGIGLPTLDAP